MTTLLLCSNHRTSGTYYEGKLTLPIPIIGKKKVDLVYAMIPNTAYTFNAEVFTFKEDVSPMPATMTIPLTGSFTATSLATYLTVQMTAKSLTHGYRKTYSVTYDQNTAKMTFSDISVVPANFQVLASGFSTALAYKLGFNVADTVAATSTTTPNILNLQPPKGCLIELEGLTMAKKIEQSDAGPLGHFFIPLTTDSFAITDYYHKSMFESEVQVHETLSHVSYRLLNPETRALLQIQSDWIVVLRIY